MRFASMGKGIGFAIGKYIGSIGQKERATYHRKILREQNELSKRLWREVKDEIRNFTDKQFEELAEFINKEVCTGERKYIDPRHEVYSRLKYDMISYQYEKVLKKIKSP